MGHESPIEPWLPLTTCSACESQSSWLHANKTMKTTGRKRQSPQALPLEVDNSTGHNTPTSLRLGWKQDRLQPPEECFLLTSSSIEPMSQVGQSTYRPGNQRKSVGPLQGHPHHLGMSLAHFICYHIPIHVHRSSDVRMAHELLLNGDRRSGGIQPRAVGVS